MYKKTYHAPAVEPAELVCEWMLASSFNGDDNTEYLGDDYGGTL